MSLPGTVHFKYILSETYLEFRFQGRLTEREEEIALRDELSIWQDTYGQRKDGKMQRSRYAEMMRYNLNVFAQSVPT